MVTLSIVVPLAPDERAWHALLESLAGGLNELPSEFTDDEVELLFVSAKDAEPLHLPSILSGRAVSCVTAGPGRARHLNAGAKAAKGLFIWFLHADSILDNGTLPLLLGAIRAYPESLLFFDLAFSTDATCLTRLNALGARFRSNRLKVPFGDQGLCLEKALFDRLGGFPEDVTYGEGHLFVWKARRHGVEIRATGGRLYSSARKYRSNGWLKTTLVHQYLWIKQALPEWRRLKAERKA